MKLSTQSHRIRLFWPDHLGIPRSKFLPIEFAASGTGHCTAVFALGYHRDMDPTPGSFMLEGLRDMRSEFKSEDVRPGWDPDTDVVVGGLRLDDGPYVWSPRHVLETAISDWAELGYEVNLGLELEAFVLEQDENGNWVPYNTPGSHVYGVGAFSDPAGLLDKIMAQARVSGFELESVNAEYDTPQFEFTLRYKKALAAVDEAFLFKAMAREVAAREGYRLTFMGKPLGDRGGSGLHLNLSLQDSQGRNALNDLDNPESLSEVAMQCLGGLVKYHRPMALLCAPTVNAYKRLQPGQMAGVYANWGYDHRGATSRVSGDRGEACRIEHRMADGAANPYTAAAAVLQAARLGVLANLDPGPPTTSDGLMTFDDVDMTPADLSEACDALEADQVFVDAVSADMVAQLLIIKRAEWQRFTEAVTDWELNEYLDYL